jgi:hypothetical protein
LPTVRQAPDAATPLGKQNEIEERGDITIGVRPHAITPTKEIALTTDTKCEHGCA